MKSLVVLMMAAQLAIPPLTPGCKRYAPNEKHLPNVPACVPLKCGPYQHEQYTPGYCANTCDQSGVACTSECRWVEPTYTCVDDIHLVTEAEWQKLLLRLANLEERVKGK